VFSPVEFYVFKDFYINGLDLGAASFRMNLRYPTNGSLTEWVVRFMGEDFEAIWLDGAWKVTASVELLGTYLIDDPT
jgi:hypothetical protein